MSFAGDLSGLGLCDVLQSISGNRKSGMLSLRWSKGERHFRCQDGGVVGVSHGPGGESPMVQFLLQRGLLEAGTLTELRKRQKRSKKSPLELLLGMSAFTAADLAAMQQQLLGESVYELVPLKEGQFAFHEQADDGLFEELPESARVRLEVGPMLLEGARRADEMGRHRAVIGGDDELFVCEGGTAPDEVSHAPEVASCLDGSTDLAGVARRLHIGRFEVSCALAWLVQNGFARAATADEIATAAKATLERGDDQAAVQLLRRALARRPRDQELRRRLCDVLQASGRAHEAAAELAVLAFQAGEEDRWSDALRDYQAALAMHPGDLALHERHCEVLARLKDLPALANATADHIRLLVQHGLLDRAIESLTAAVDEGPLRRSAPLIEQLAGLLVEKGDKAEACRRYLQLANLADWVDDELTWLRRGLAADPDDTALAARIRDIESGRAALRRRRRRIFAWAGSLAASGLLAVTFALGEAHAARQLSAAMQEALDDDVGDRTLAELQRIGESHSWLPSGWAASGKAAQLAERTFARAVVHWHEGRVEQAERGFAAARGLLPAEQHDAVAAFAARIETERPLHDLLARIERRGTDDSEACAALARAADPTHVPFLCDQLPRARCNAARQSLLLAMQQSRDPRCVRAVVSMLMTPCESAVALLARQVLLDLGPKADLKAIDGDLRTARQHPELRPRVEAVLELLTSQAAAPR